jgi:hypothetical protein
MDWWSKAKVAGKGGALGLVIYFVAGEIREERGARERAVQTLASSFSAAMVATESLHQKEHEAIREVQRRDARRIYKSLGRIEGHLQAMREAERSPSEEARSRFGKRTPERKRGDG